MEKAAHDETVFREIPVLPVNGCHRAMLLFYRPCAPGRLPKNNQCIDENLAIPTCSISKTHNGQATDPCMLQHADLGRGVAHCIDPNIFIAMFISVHLYGTPINIHF